MFTEACCQRFFVQGCQSSFFAVHVIPKVQNANKKLSGQKNDLLRTILNKHLHANELEQQVKTQTYSSSVTKTEVSPWLEMTTWPRYLNGLDMTQIAPLGWGCIVGKERRCGWEERGGGTWICGCGGFELFEGRV
jgi:hypothetical protein